MQDVFSLGLSRYVFLRKKTVKKYLFLTTDPVFNKSCKIYNLLTALITKQEEITPYSKHQCEHTVAAGL